MKKFLSLLLIFTLMVPQFAGCTVARSTIAYTVYPVGYLIERLAGNEIRSESIQDQNTLVQRATVRSDFKEYLATSAVFFHIGTLEPYLTVYQKEIQDTGVQDYDLSSLNAVYKFQRYTQVVTDGEVSYVESPYYKGDEFNLIDTDTLDLYLWNDPIAMLSMAKNICQWLERNYPENEAVFEDNLTKLETDLINLDAQYQALATSLVSNNQEIRFVSMTASFGNWQKTYGFQVYPVILSKYGVLPNEKQLDSIKSRILADGVKYIVYEPNMTPEMTDLFNEIESELGLTRVELSNLSSLTETEAADGKDYISVMYENLSVLETMKTARVTSGSEENDE